MKKLFGIIGNPIKHSLSPVLHNYWFKKYNINADYSLIEATNEDLPEIIKRLKDGTYSGLNVTLPFKQKIINFIDKAVNDAELTGSVNTLLLDNKKTIVGESAGGESVSYQMMIYLFSQVIYDHVNRLREN